MCCNLCSSFIKADWYLTFPLKWIIVSQLCGLFSFLSFEKTVYFLQQIPQADGLWLSVCWIYTRLINDFLRKHWAWEDRDREYEGDEEGLFDAEVCVRQRGC